MYIIADPSTGDECLHYKDQLDEKDRVSTYFELVRTGVIRHLVSGLYIMSEGSKIDVGYNLKLKQGPIPEDGDTIKNFSFTFTDKKLWKHNLSGLYIQPEGGSVHSGAKLAAYDYEEGKSQTPLSAMEFILPKIQSEQVQKDLDGKKMSDEETAFLNSSDGIALSANNRVMQGEEEIIEIGFADPAKIELGINVLMISTFNNPVLNLSLNCDNAFSLTYENGNDDENWSLTMANPNLIRPKDQNEIYGSELKIINEFGKCLACNEQGELCCDDGPGAVWNILKADDHTKYFIVNHAYPYALARFQNAVKLVPKTSKPHDGTMYWVISNSN
jgi:hypothetical protein